MTERYNLLTPSGNPAHNQHVDLYPDHLLFRSHGRAVARRSYQFDQVELHPRWWDYSQTTMKYLCKFLSRDGDKVNLKILRKRIEDGVYLLVDLDNRCKTCGKNHPTETPTGIPYIHCTRCGITHPERHLCLKCDKENIHD